MNLLVARRMEKHAVVFCVWSPKRSPEKMMAVPSRNLGDLLVTNWAEPILLFPEIDEPLFPFVGIHHLHVQALFIVGFPRGIVWISFSTDFRVSFDWKPCGVCEILNVFFDGSVE